jgi:hypothetical protein
MAGPGGCQSSLRSRHRRGDGRDINQHAGNRRPRRARRPVRSGHQSRSGRRAQRGRVKVCVADSVVCDAIQGRGWDDTARRPRCAEADIIRHDEQNVGRSLRRHDAWAPPRRWLPGPILDHPSNLGSGAGVVCRWSWWRRRANRCRCQSVRVVVLLPCLSLRSMPRRRQPGATDRRRRSCFCCRLE